MSADITASLAWQSLERHHQAVASKNLRELFAEDPARGTELALTVGDLYIDYSKHRVTRETLALLVDLAEAADLPGRRDAMIGGAHINTSEIARCCTPRCGCRGTPR
jgi:glucose-6-phosphate isomerase